VPSGSIERVFVLGIDPGLTRCGYGCVGLVAGREQVRAAGIVTTDRHSPLGARLAELHRELTAIARECAPEVVAVERVLFQTNARTAMSVGQANGVALLVAAEAGLPIVEYSANEVKLAVAGYGSATKAQVQQMVAALCGLEVIPRPPDVADALALALCHLAASRATRRAAPGTISTFAVRHATSPLGSPLDGHLDRAADGRGAPTMDATR